MLTHLGTKDDIIGIVLVRALEFGAMLVAGNNIMISVAQDDLDWHIKRIFFVVFVYCLLNFCQT